ncbi:MAG: TylF/MycF/NovP-related O-methyltransferase [Candidatus Sulfotelmatobacter sp.]
MVSRRALFKAILSPISILAMLSSKRIHPAYRMTTWRKLKLGWSFYWNRKTIVSATDVDVQLAMALKLLEMPPDLPGVVVECGTFKGGTAANLSLVCKIVGRELFIFDSFEGLPEGLPQDREARYYAKGDWAGTFEEVSNNIRKGGDLSRCTLVRGWFDKTLPLFDREIVLAYVDVDLEASLDTCIKNLWRRLSKSGFIFIDECLSTNYCSLFYSERWWRTNFDCTPPGLIGAGTGLAIGNYYVGPIEEIGDHPRHHSSSGAYTSKQMSGSWTYYPEDVVQNMPHSE